METIKTEAEKMVDILRSDDWKNMTTKMEDKVTQEIKSSRSPEYAKFLGQTDEEFESDLVSNFKASFEKDNNPEQYTQEDRDEWCSSM
jgi:hypothetical protein